MRKSLNTQKPYSNNFQSQEVTEDDDDDSDEQQQQKKRKKKPAIIPRFIKNQIDEIDTDVIILNISRTQYQVVQQVAKQLGWEVQRSKKSQKWDIMWIDSHIQSHDLFKLNQHQKISHFPAIYVLTRKNFLGRSLMKMRNYFPQQYNYFPSTWSIPTELTELIRYDEKVQRKQQNQFYIYKPEASAQGKGIKLYQNVQQLQGKTGIVQQYINNPYLIQNLKFDFRIYVLILGYNPIRIFIYDEGLARFATQKYQKVQKKNMKQVHMHLTNYAINKNNKNFIFNNSEKDMNKGHKRSLSAIFKYLQEKKKGVDVNKIKQKIDQIIVKTLIVGQPMITHTYGLSQSDTFHNQLCFQILGFDILLNEELEPKLLEVNHTPSFTTDTPLDKYIKKNLIKDTLNLLNINTQNKKIKVEQKKQFIEMRSQRKLTRISVQQKEQIRRRKIKQRDQYQLSHLGNFRKIFPNQNAYKYKEMIQMSNKIFNQAHGIKNKGLTMNSSNTATKLSLTVRPRSLDRTQMQGNEPRSINNPVTSYNYLGENSPLLSSIKQKLLGPKYNVSRYSKTQALRAVENGQQKQIKQVKQIKQLDIDEIQNRKQDEKQGQKEKKPCQAISRNSIEKFPTINSPKRHQKIKQMSRQREREKFRNYSAYMASNLKEQKIKPTNINPSNTNNKSSISANKYNQANISMRRNNTININPTISPTKLERANSHKKNSIIQPIQHQLYANHSYNQVYGNPNNTSNPNMNNMGSIQTSAMYKGNYIMPKTLEMGEIVSNSSASMNNNLTMHRSTQLNTSNPLANPQNTNASSLYNSNEAHTHIMNTNVNINTITKSYNMPVQLPITSYNQSTNGNSTNKIRNFEQVASQASMQILSFSPNHHKVTYQNLLANLCNNNVSSVSKNISSHNKHILTTNSNKQQFIKLKPIKKY